MLWACVRKEEGHKILIGGTGNEGVRIMGVVREKVQRKLEKVTSRSKKT